MRPIDADEYEKLLEKDKKLFSQKGSFYYEGVRVGLERARVGLHRDAKAVDAEPVVHAHWEESVWGPICSECGEDLEQAIHLKASKALKDFDVEDNECYEYVDIAKPYPDYCPCCGAKTDGGMIHGNE